MSKVLEVAKQIDYINERFSEGARLTVQELSDEMKEQGFESCSVPTLYRRLSDMKKKDAKYATDEEGRWYAIEGQTVLLPSFITSSENIKYIKIIQNLVNSLKGTPVYEKASRIFNELAKISPAESNFGRTAYNSNPVSASSRVVFLGAPANNVQPSVWKEIFQAMEKNNYISIEYQRPGSKSSYSISVQPFQLIFDDGIWDLWCMECKTRERRLYNLSRISRVTIKPETWKLPEDFSFLNETSGAFGCYRDIEGTDPGKTLYQIWLRKDSYARSFAKERLWGDNQQIEEKEDGSILSFYGNQFKPVLRWVLGWGGDARPVSPDALVEEWKTQVEAMTHLIQ